MTKEKIRIWIWWNGPTRITLIKDRAVRLSKSEPTEEGYSYDEEEYVFDGEDVLRESASGGSDCDGPIDHYNNYVWNPAMGVSERGFPLWKNKKSWQRDAFAEAAGY